jgi:DMSO/TMAO reductase YedYZ molybdopterin-dependent catalytic subunit
MEMRMMGEEGFLLARRRFLHAAGIAGSLALFAGRAVAQSMPTIRLPFSNGSRPLSDAFPQKGRMILQRARPPLLETPFDVFDKGVFTPNNRFYVRWHLPDIPTSIDPVAFRLTVRGQVRKPLELTLRQLMEDFEPVELAAVNQCSGNSRGFYEPRVPGAQWGNGAMGNALWRGVRLKDVLDRAGVAPGALQVRFDGLDSGLLPATPDFLKSLDVDHARDGEVMLAYAMNGAPLPLLNGFPLRLIVPGWFATYWVKMLNDIEVLDKADDNYWMAKAYRIPDTPGANTTPDATGVKTAPISRMTPRSFITNLREHDVVRVGQDNPVRGIAFGGDTGVARVMWSSDGGTQWREATLEEDKGRYGFRRWHTAYRPQVAGPQKLLVKAINTRGEEQPMVSNWNPGGFMRNVVESVGITAA